MFEGFDTEDERRRTPRAQQTFLLYSGVEFGTAKYVATLGEPTEDEFIIDERARSLAGMDFSPYQGSFFRQVIASVVEGFGGLRESQGARKDTKRLVRDAKVFSPGISQLPGGASRSTALPHPVEPKVMLPAVDETTQSVVAVNSVSSEQSEAAANPVWSVNELRVSSTLQKR